MRLWWGSGCDAWNRRPATAVPRNVLLVVAVLSATVIAAYREGEVWTPLQRWYLVAYARSGLAFSDTGSYELLQVVDPKGRRLALDDEIVWVTTAPGETSFALSAAAVKAGATRVDWDRQVYNQAALHAFLGRWIYQDQSLVDLAAPALWGAFAVFLGGVIGAVSHTVTQARVSRARHPPGETDWSLTPTFHTHVDSPRTAEALCVPAAEQASTHSLMRVPTGSHRKSTRVLAAADAADARASHHAPPVSWSDAYFK